MQPSTTIMQDQAALRCTTDSLGRKLAVRSLTALDRLRIFKAAGPDLSLNQPWLAVAVLASSVAAVDDVPVPFPGNEAQIETIVSRLGDPGLEAVAEIVDAPQGPGEKEQLVAAGNLSGTPS